MTDKQTTLFGEDISPPIIPSEYMGEYKKNGGYTKTTPRQWTSEEIDYMTTLIQEGYTTKQISQILHRSNTSVAIKRKRLQKNEQTRHEYNKEHHHEKQKRNNEFLQFMQPRNVLDPYNGGNTQYKEYNPVTNDIDESLQTDYHMDAYNFMIQQYLEGNKYDFVDLDPFGSPYDCIDIAFKLIRTSNPNKRGGGICITFGEYGHKRWKRLDYVSRMYGIQSLEDFTVPSLLCEVQRVALRNKQRIHVYNVCTWRNIARVYLQVYPLKITGQWQEKKDTTNICIPLGVDEKNMLRNIALENDYTTEELLHDVIQDFCRNQPK